MSREQMLLFWEAFARAYTGNDDVESLNRQLRPYAALDVVRTFYLHSVNHPAFLAFLRGVVQELCSL